MSDVKEALEGLENEAAALIEDLRHGKPSAYVDFKEGFAAHLSTVREWILWLERGLAEFKEATERQDVEIARLREDCDTCEANCLQEDRARLRGKVSDLKNAAKEWAKHRQKLETRLVVERDALTAALEEITHNHCECGSNVIAHKALSGKGEGEARCKRCYDQKRLYDSDNETYVPCPECTDVTKTIRPPPDPLCTHCDDTRRVQTECGDVVCPMCKPCECGGSGEVHSRTDNKGRKEFLLRGKIPCPKGCKPEGGGDATEKARAILDAAKRGAKVTVVIPPDKKGGGE